MSSLSRIILFLSLILLLAGCQQQALEQRKLKVNNKLLAVEVAKTQAQQSQGLAHRQSLCDSCGMLFEFSDSKIRAFWMKGMNFPLDIIWIKDKQIVGFAENVPILDSTGNISQVNSLSLVNRVLEVGSGWVKKSNVKAGDVVAGLDTPSP